MVVEPERFQMRRLDRYVLIRRIASGGMGELFLGLVLGLADFRKVVAVKTLHPHLADNQKFIDLFLDEARLAARLNHANIVHTFDLGQHERTHFIAMEFIHGVSLSELLNKGPLPLEVAMTIAIEATAGLAFAHTANDEQGRPLKLVHRDIAPKNILVSFAGEVKVVDFGVARATDQLHETVTGEIKGTMSYMAPEQLEGQRVDARADVYAMGVTLFELFTARRLFRGIPRSKLFDHAIRRNVVAPSTLRGELPEAIDQIVLRALSLEPALRHANCAALLKDLRKAAGTMGVVPAPEPIAETLAERFAERANRKLLTEQQIVAAERFGASKLDIDPTTINSEMTEEGAVLGAMNEGALRLEAMGPASEGHVEREAETVSGPQPKPATGPTADEGALAVLLAGSVEAERTGPGLDGAPILLLKKSAVTGEKGSSAPDLAPREPWSLSEQSLGEQPSDSMVRGERLEPSMTAVLARPSKSWGKPIALAALFGALTIGGAFWYVRSHQAPVQVIVVKGDPTAATSKPPGETPTAAPRHAEPPAVAAVKPPRRKPLIKRRTTPKPLPRPAVAAPQQKVRIGIRTTPVGAMVLVDGVDEGRTPMTLVRKLDASTSVNLLLKLANHIPARRRVTLGANAELEVLLTAKPKPPPKANIAKKPKAPAKTTRVDDLK